MRSVLSQPVTVTSSVRVFDVVVSDCSAAIHVCYSRGTVRAPELGPDHLWALVVLTHLNLDLGWACGCKGARMQENIAIAGFGIIVGRGSSLAYLQSKNVN